jgi:hypothetical protein
MPTSTYLSNPVVLIGATSASTTDITDMVSACSLVVTKEALEDTAFGQNSRTMTGGLFSNTCTLSIYASYATSESYSVLSALLGTKCYIKVTPASGANTATNPGFELTETFMSSLPVINASLGELSVYEIELEGGSYTIDVT